MNTFARKALFSAMIGLYQEAEAAQTAAGTTTDQATAPAAAAAPAEPAGPAKTRFFFKKKKDENGKDIPAPEAVEAVVPKITMDDVAAILTKNDPKEIELMLEALNDVILSQARSQVDDDPEKVRKEGLDNTQLTWNFIANVPPATRRGGGIADEVWEAFQKDYVETMVHHGKTQEKATTGAKILAKRFAAVKDNKKVVTALKDNVVLWYANTEKADEFAGVYEALTSRADTLLAKDEEAILAAI